MNKRQKKKFIKKKCCKTYQLFRSLHILEFTDKSLKEYLEGLKNYIDTLPWITEETEGKCSEGEELPFPYLKKETPILDGFDKKSITQLIPFTSHSRIKHSSELLNWCEPTDQLFTYAALRKSKGEESCGLTLTDMTTFELLDDKGNKIDMEDYVMKPYTTTVGSANLPIITHDSEILKDNE